MKKIAFIRIPKTGSTSFADSIKNSNNIISVDHAYCYRTNILNTGWIWSKDFPYFDLNNYDKVYTLVRNPYDVLISYYYHTHKDSQKLDGWCNCNIIHSFNSWEEFLKAYIDPTFKWHLPPMKKSLFSMAYDEGWNLIIDKYFKIENPNDINNFLQDNNFPSLGKLNITKNKVLKKHYTPIQIEKLNKIWEKDLNHFNYQYEGQ